MKNPSDIRLAQIIVHHSLKLQKGETVLIKGNGFVLKPLIQAILRIAKEAGALPLYQFDDGGTFREWLKDADPALFDIAAETDAYQMQRMDAFVGITAPENALECSDIKEETMSLYQTRYYNPVHMKIRLPKTRWVVLRYPTNAFAQSAGMSFEGFENWYYDVCTVNYEKMSRAMKPLVKLMEQTNHVRILGPGETDLSFSIKDIPVVPCAGEMNIPDGEVYTAPVKDSVEGVISFNTSSIEDGFEFKYIKLKFSHGRIVEASANDTPRLNSILDRDEGSKYIGEFAIGVNPQVDKFVNNTLFDEKIRGSLHLALGNSYDDAFNGNKSSLHWDIVLLQEPPLGLGELWFDNTLIRKDGRFVQEELRALNPENIMSNKDI